MHDLYKLQIFEQVVRDGSFSRAAQSLLMTQSAISQHMRDVEHSFGATLFERTSRGVRLTAAGEVLHSYTLQILQLLKEAEQAIDNLAESAQGQIVLGVTPGVGGYLLPDWILPFQQKYDHITLTMQTAISSQIVENLHKDLLDLGVIEGELEVPTASWLGVVELGEIEQVVVIGPHHRWWNRELIQIAELDGQTMIMRQPGSQTRAWLDAKLKEHGVQPQIGAVFDNVESIKRVVARGENIAILPPYAVQEEVSAGMLQTLTVEERHLCRTLKLVWRQSRPFSRAAVALIRYLSSLWPAVARVLP
ncbi:MAG: LysR family transcriptional regulator [Caldilineaceae bacterium]